MQNIGLFCRALLQKRPRRVSQALRRGAQALPIRSEQKSVYGVETPLPSPAPKGAGLRHFPFAPNKRVYTGSKPRSQGSGASWAAWHRRKGFPLPIRSEQKNVYGVETPFPSPAPKGAGLLGRPGIAGKDSHSTLYMCCAMSHEVATIRRLPKNIRLFYRALLQKRPIIYRGLLQKTKMNFSEMSMGWLRFVGSLKTYVSFAKEPYKKDDILQKKPIF